MNRQELARKKAKDKISFYRHLTWFILINAVLLILSSFGSFPVILFWGIGLASHYVRVFGWPGAQGVLSEEWQQKIYDEELEKAGGKQETMDLDFPQPQPLKKWDEKDLVK